MQTKSRKFGMDFTYKREGLEMKIPINVKLKYTLTDDWTEITNIEVKSISIPVDGLFLKKAMVEFCKLAKPQAKKWLDDNRESEIAKYKEKMLEMKDVVDEKFKEINSVDEKETE